MGIRFARTSIISDQLVRTGERDKVFARIKEWALNAKGFIKISDPFFGCEELEMILLIREINPSIPIYILTSKKHQLEQKYQTPLDDSYQTYWRMKVSYNAPGDVTIIIIGVESQMDSPIHDRWWLSEQSGLRFGTSANSIGITKIAEISEFSESEVQERLTEIDIYIYKKAKDFGGNKIRYLEFNL